MVVHVTKDDEMSGPKTLEHMVDTVLFMDGDRQTSLRMLYSQKPFWFYRGSRYFSNRKRALSLLIILPISL